MPRRLNAATAASVSSAVLQTTTSALSESIHSVPEHGKSHLSHFAILLRPRQIHRRGGAHPVTSRVTLAVFAPTCVVGGGSFHTSTGALPCSPHRNSQLANAVLMFFP